MISDPLTKLQCSPTSDGSGAAIVVSEAFVDSHGLADQAVEIVGQAMTTDFASTFDGSAANLIGHDMNVKAAQQVYAQSGLGPEDFQVIELHDCFSANELLLYEALGLCGPGEAPALIDNEDTTYGGRWVVNPSGGLISKGHPLGRHRAGPVRRADLAAARHRRQASGRQRDRGTAAQHRARRGGRGHRLPARRSAEPGPQASGQVALPPVASSTTVNSDSPGPASASGSMSGSSCPLFRRCSCLTG